MTDKDFELEAASFFLCEYQECTVEHQYELLKKAENEIPEDVVVWEPFSHYSLGDLMEQIDRFTDMIRRIYYAGRNAQQGNN